MGRWACVFAVGLCALARVGAVQADPTAAQAVAELNAWRAQVGESLVSTTTVSAWNTGCQHHNAYEQDHQTLTHFETDTNPASGYTTDGAEAGPDSVLGEDRSSPNATPDSRLLPGPVWDSAVFHRAAVLEPRLAQIGYDSSTFAPASSGGFYTSWTCLWDQNLSGEMPPQPPALDSTRTTPGVTLYPSPANGAFDVPTTFPAGTEEPDPGQETGLLPNATLGWLLNVEINGPWANAGGGGIVWTHGVTVTLEPDGTSAVVPVVVSQCGTGPCAPSGSTCSTATNGTAYGCYFGGGFGVFPKQALADNTTYHVAASGTLTDDTNPSTPVIYPISLQWCFSTGLTYTPSGDCAASTTGAGAEPAVPPPNLSVSLTGSGSGTVAGSGISCPTTCSQSYQAGTAVTLTASPAAGSRFAGWSGGGCSGTGACTMTLSSDTTVTAMFTAVAALTVSKVGSGSGGVSSRTPPGITCGATCSHTFDAGTMVTLDATPAAGSRFAGWSGGGCSGTGSCVLTLSSDTTVSAAFIAIAPPSTTGGSLTGAKSGKPKLAFVVHGGRNAPAIKTIRVGLPNGFVFSRDARKLNAGLALRGADGKRLKFAATVGKDGLTITLRTAATLVHVTIAGPAITVGKTLARKIKRKAVKSLPFVLKVIDARGTTTTLRLTLAAS
jgi:hypothetical protein